MDRKKLVAVVKKLNEAELADPVDVKVKEEELKELFGQAVDSVLDNEEYGETDEERQQKLPEEVRAAYKELFLDSDPEEPIETEKKDEKKKAKGEKEMKKDEKKKAKGEKEMKKDEKKKAEGEKEMKKDEKKKAAKKEGVKKVGIIDTIISLLKTKPITKEDIVKALVKKFPDREEKGMTSTVSIQLGGRLEKDKGLKIQKSDKGYSIK